MHKLFHRVHLSVSVSALITLVVGLGLTALLFASVRRVESNTHQLKFAQEASLRTAAVADGLAGAVEQLTVLNQVFRTVGVVSREQFARLTAPLLLRHPGIQALSFQRLVSDAGRASYEAAAARRLPGFAITELIDGQQRVAGRRDMYNVVDYIEPVQGNAAAIGLDTAVTADQADARARSRATGAVAATGLLTLAQARRSHSAFLLLAPVYWQGAPLDTPAQRQRAVIGETAAVFQLDHLVETILARGGLIDDPAIAFRLYATGSGDSGKVAYQHGAAPAPETLSGWLPGWLLADMAKPISAGFDLAGNPWHMVVTSVPVPFYRGHNGSLYALLGGVLSSLLASAYIWSVVSRQSAIERVAGERTAALQSTNLRLAEDLALRVRTEKSLRLRERVIEVSTNAIVICSATAPDYAIEYVNPAFERITGYTPAEVVGRSLESMQGNSQDQQNMDEIRAALREQREGHALLRNYRKDGSGYWNDLFIAPVRDENDVLSHFVVAQYDISAVMRYEAELEFQAKHDALTGLANRTLLTARLDQAIDHAFEHGTQLWMVFIDLDRFKFVNDTLGHAAGDALLKTLALRLQAVARETDTLARVGGDEFVLLLSKLAERSECIAVLERIMETVSQPLLIQDREFFLTCSIGVASYPQDGDTAEILSKHADIAMYRAKESGRNSFQFYTPSMNERTLDRLRIEADLRHALDRDEFSLHYQPQVCMETGRVVGMEALLRWRHPVLGMIGPARFIGLAEELGLIIPIGAWVLRTACIQTKAWHDAGFAHLRVAVNLSARQFTQHALAQSVADVLHATGLAPRYLELELTESMVMGDVDHAITILRNLKALGLHISIDDFGTGYSSLSYLRRFPIDVLKIDQSFVNDITHDADDAAIVISIISLAHSLRLTVIAEGVETLEQLAFLRDHGCEQAQGYYFSRPLEVEQFTRLLQSEGGYAWDDRRGVVDSAAHAVVPA